MVAPLPKPGEAMVAPLPKPGEATQAPRPKPGFFFTASLANVKAVEPFEFVFKVFMVCQSQSMTTRVGWFLNTHNGIGDSYIAQTMAMRALALPRPSVGESDSSSNNSKVKRG